MKQPQEQPQKSQQPQKPQQQCHTVLKGYRFIVAECYTQTMRHIILSKLRSYGGEVLREIGPSLNYVISQYLDCIPPNLPKGKFAIKSKAAERDWRSR
jgi:hypothetical protein